MGCAGPAPLGAARFVTPGRSRLVGDRAGRVWVDELYEPVELRQRHHVPGVWRSTCERHKSFLPREPQMRATYPAGSLARKVASACHHAGEFSNCGQCPAFGMTASSAWPTSAAMVRDAARNGWSCSPTMTSTGKVS